MRTDILTIHYNATDPEPGSGMSSLIGQFDCQPVADGQQIDLFWSKLGNHSLVVDAADNAGQRTKHKKAIQIIATLASIRLTIDRLLNEKEIDQETFTQSLLHKLNSKGDCKNLKALIQELNAQSGKHITRRAADLLIGDVQYILDH